MTGAAKFKVAAYAVFTAAAAAFFFYMRSDAVSIRRTFDAVSDLAGRKAGETVMEGAIRAREIAAYLGGSFRLVLPGYGVRTSVSRENAAGAVLALRSDFSRLDVGFRNLETVSDDGVAIVTGVVELGGEAGPDGFPLPCEFVFEAELKKVDGRWVFTRFEGRRGTPDA